MKKQVLLSCIAAVLCFAIGFGTVALIKGGIGGNDLPGTTSTGEGNVSEGVVLDLKNMTEGISVTSRSFFPNNNALFEKLNLIRYGIENGKLNDKTLASELESAIRELEQLGFYYDYINKTSITGEDGTVYGAAGNEQGPIGGGEGYKDVFTTGDFIVTDDNTFYAAVKEAKAGDVIFIQSGAVIDISDMAITDYPNCQIKQGVTIASDRGHRGSGGGVLKYSLHLSTMFKTHHNVRITGLVLQGSDATTHEGEEKYSTTIGFVAQGDNLVIDNCEISGFNGSGISTNIGSIHIHHCYIHHIKGEGNGHGVLVTKANVKLEYNLFSNCRNAITMSGATAGSFEAYNNVEVGNSLGAMFYIKSSSVNSPKVNGMKQSGSSVIIKNNTVLGSTLPIKLEGMPESYTVENNLFSLDESQYDANLFYGPEACRESIKANSTFRNNAFNITAPYALTWNEKALETTSADSAE